MIKGIALALALEFARLRAGCLRERGTYGVYVVCRPVVGCRGGGGIGRVAEVGFADADMKEPVGLAVAGLKGSERAGGRFVKEVVGEEEAEEEAVEGEGEERPAGTTSG